MLSRLTLKHGEKETLKSKSNVGEDQWKVLLFKNCLFNQPQQIQVSTVLVSKIESFFFRICGKIFFGKS